jgi:hypothetical protein
VGIPDDYNDTGTSSANTDDVDRKEGKMSLDTLRAMLAAEYESAMGALQASRLVTDRADALDYYFGHMAKDMPTQDGRSQAVSYDVADTIEGLMPSMMEIFAGSDEVVQFDPVGPEDVAAAQQETDYVNHVFMNQNSGFLILYSFIKDALLSKNGIVKIFWDEREVHEKETYYDQSDDAFGLIVDSPDVDVVAHTEKDDPYNPGQKLHDVTVTKKKSYAQATVVPVPPEEFVIERGARTIHNQAIGGCNYCCHKVIKSEARLIEQGFDPEQVRSLPIYRAYTNPEEIARDTVDEHQFYGDDVNQAARLKQVFEHYVRMDYEGDGVSRLYRVTTSGTTGEVLNLDGKPDIFEVDYIPFAAMTPQIVTHRFWGRSIHDMVGDIQRIKTAMTRGILDNIYLALDPRVEVSESHASDNTLDDLLTSRPGAVVRTKQPGGLNAFEVPNITGEIFPALEYYDTLREWRTGVSRMGQGIDAKVLADQSATAANLAYSASQSRMRLIARTFAETGIRDMFWLLHATIREHGQKAQTVRIRNQWVTVDPRNWKTRNDLTINVGGGQAGRAQRLAEVNMIAMAQEKLLSGGVSQLVSPQNLYNTAKLLTQAVGEKDVAAYFTDPSQNPQPPQQQPPDPEVIKAQAQMQLQQLKTESDVEMQKARLQADMTLEQQKFEHQKELDYIEMGMKRQEHEHKIAQMAATPHTSKGENGETVVHHDSTAPMLQMVLDHLKQLNAPKRVVRDGQGRVSHVEPIK